MTCATFVLSTGRCGTQWLTRNLGLAYQDRAVVTHEPLYINYLPRRLVGLDDPLDAGTSSLIRGHLANIRKALETKDYIECGWPCYGAIPYFADQLDGRCRVIHLTRHPVFSASSMLTHRFYGQRPVDDGFEEKVLLTPFDKGVRYSRISKKWDSMQDFEKCLYLWAEVHGYALEQEKKLNVPWLRLKFEDLFSKDGLKQLLEFLDLPHRPAVYEEAGRVYDSHSHRADHEWDIGMIKNYPEVITIAHQIGYEPLKADINSVRRRYGPAHE